MSGSMQQNIRKAALKKHLKVGANYPEYERRMVNLASMVNSRLQRIGLVCCNIPGESLSPHLCGQGLEGDGADAEGVLMASIGV